jgi:hypothetical protein
MVIVEQWKRPVMVIAEQWRLPVMVIAEQWRLPVMVIAEQWKRPVMVIVEQWRLLAMAIQEQWRRLAMETVAEILLFVSNKQKSADQFSLFWLHFVMPLSSYCNANVLFAGLSHTHRPSSSVVGSPASTPVAAQEQREISFS